MEEAFFVPVEANRLSETMGAWERYIHTEAPDRLVQLAVINAEFEALHPFLDGNGRLGRILVPLFLWQAALIRSPMFYISAYFETHRDAYYDGLLSVSRDDDWTGWCRFFLEALRVQAEDSMDRAQRILGLYNAMMVRMTDLTRSHYAVYALGWIFKRPIFRSADFVSGLAIPARTARRILRVLCDAGILNTIVEARGRRSSVLAFPELLKVTESEEVP